MKMMKNIFFIILLFPTLLFSQGISVGVNAVDESGTNAYLKDVGFGLDKTQSTVLIDPTEVDYWDWANFPVIDVKKYGAVGDSATDDYTSISNAIKSMLTGGILYFPKGTYRLSGEIKETISGDIKIICDPGVVIITSITGNSSSTKFLFSLRCDTTTRVVGVTASKLDTVISLSGHGLKKNDIIRIGSDSEYDIDTYRGELIKVKAIDGDNVTFFSPLRENYSGAWIRKIESYRIEIDGGTFIGPGSNQTKFQNISLEGFNQIKISNVKTQNAHYAGLVIRDIYHGLVENCEFSDGVTIGLGYGTIISSCQNITYANCIAQNSAHAIAMGGSYPVRNVTVRDCWLYGRTGSTSPLENHPVAFNINYINNHIFNGGIRARGNDHNIIGNDIHISEDQSGIYLQLQTERSSYVNIVNNTIIDDLKSNVTNGISVINYSSLDTLDNLNIESNIIDVNGYGIMFSRNSESCDSNYIENISITDNKINSHVGAGIYLFPYNSRKNVFITNNNISNTVGIGINIDAIDSIDNVVVSGNRIITTSTHSPIYLMPNVKVGVVNNNFIIGDGLTTDGVRLSARTSILKDNYIFNILNGGYIVQNTCKYFWDINNIKIVDGTVTNSAGVSHIMEIE